MVLISMRPSATTEPGGRVGMMVVAGATANCDRQCFIECRHVRRDPRNNNTCAFTDVVERKRPLPQAKA